MTLVEEAIQIFLTITATFQYINECIQFHFYIFNLLLLFVSLLLLLLLKLLLQHFRLYN